MLALATMIGVLLIKPVVPINSPLWEVTSEVKGELVEMIGWPDLVEHVAEIYRGLPEMKKPRTAILARNYGEAGALELYGPRYDLPPIISGSNSLWTRGYGDPEPEMVIAVGFERAEVVRWFAMCEMAGHVTNRYGVQNEETTRHTGLYICRQPRQPWPQMWTNMRWFQ